MWNVSRGVRNASSKDGHFSSAEKTFKLERFSNKHFARVKKQEEGGRRDVYDVL